MAPMISRSILVALAAFVFVPGAQAEQTSYEAQLEGYSLFLVKVQQAFRAGDRAEVLGLIRVPLRVNQPDGKGPVWYRDIHQVKASFDVIFDRQTIDAILEQSPESIFSRDIGAMVGVGEVWFDNTCLDEACEKLGPVKIYAINHM